MRVAFVYSTYENIGVEYISSVIKKEGHETRLFYDPRLFNDLIISNSALGKAFSFKKNIIADLISYKPELVLFSIVSADYKWACDYAKTIKRHLSTKIIFGGIHVTSMPEKIIRHCFVDYIVIGEGIPTIKDLVRSISSDVPADSIMNVWLKKDGKIIKNPVRPLIKDLDKLPYPDKGLYREHGEPFLTGYTIQTSHGCPKRCTFCSHDIYKNYYDEGKQYIRKRSIKNVISELRDAKKRYSYGYVRFFDDDFTRDTGRIECLSREYRKHIDLPYTCIAHPETIDERTIEALKKSRCMQINLGFENIDESIRRDILRRHDKNKDIIRALVLLKRSGIRSIVDFMMGIPTADKRNIDDNFRFFYEHTPTRIFILWLQYMPRTEICNIALDKGVLDKGMVNRIENDPYNRSILTVDERVHNKDMVKYNILFVSLVISKRLAKILYKTKLYKLIPANLAIFLSIIENVKSWKSYEHEQIRNLKRYLHYTYKKIAS